MTQDCGPVGSHPRSVEQDKALEARLQPWNRSELSATARAFALKYEAVTLDAQTEKFVDSPATPAASGTLMGESADEFDWEGNPLVIMTENANNTGVEPADEYHDQPIYAMGDDTVDHTYPPEMADEYYLPQEVFFDPILVEDPPPEDKGGIEFLINTPPPPDPDVNGIVLLDGYGAIEVVIDDDIQIVQVPLKSSAYRVYTGERNKTGKRSAKYTKLMTALTRSILSLSMLVAVMGATYEFGSIHFPSNEHGGQVSFDCDPSGNRSAIMLAQINKWAEDWPAAYLINEGPYEIEYDALSDGVVDGLEELIQARVGPYKGNESHGIKHEKLYTKSDPPPSRPSESYFYTYKSVSWDLDTAMNKIYILGFTDVFPPIWDIAAVLSKIWFALAKVVICKAVSCGYAIGPFCFDCFYYCVKTIVIAILAQIMEVMYTIRYDEEDTLMQTGKTMVNVFIALFVVIALKKLIWGICKVLYLFRKSIYGVWYGIWYGYAWLKMELYYTLFFIEWRQLLKGKLVRNSPETVSEWQTPTIKKAGIAEKSYSQEAAIPDSEINYHLKMDDKMLRSQVILYYERVDHETNEKKMCPVGPGTYVKYKCKDGIYMNFLQTAAHTGDKSTHFSAANTVDAGKTVQRFCALPEPVLMCKYAHGDDTDMASYIITGQMAALASGRVDAGQYPQLQPIESCSRNGRNFITSTGPCSNVWVNGLKDGKMAWSTGKVVDRVTNNWAHGAHMASTLPGFSGGGIFIKKEGIPFFAGIHLGARDSVNYFVVAEAMHDYFADRDYMDHESDPENNRGVYYGTKRLINNEGEILGEQIEVKGANVQEGLNGSQGKGFNRKYGDAGSRNDSDARGKRADRMRFVNDASNSGHTQHSLESSIRGVRAVDLIRMLVYKDIIEQGLQRQENTDVEDRERFKKLYSRTKEELDEYETCHKARAEIVNDLCGGSEWGRSKTLAHAFFNRYAEGVIGGFNVVTFDDYDTIRAVIKKFNTQGQDGVFQSAIATGFQTPVFEKAEMSDAVQDEIAEKHDAAMKAAVEAASKLEIKRKFDEDKAKRKAELALAEEVAMARKAATAERLRLEHERLIAKARVDLVNKGQLYQSSFLKFMKLGKGTKEDRQALQDEVDKHMNDFSALLVVLRDVVTAAGATMQEQIDENDDLCALLQTSAAHMLMEAVVTKDFRQPPQTAEEPRQAMDEPPLVVDQLPILQEHECLMDEVPVVKFTTTNTVEKEESTGFTQVKNRQTATYTGAACPIPPPPPNPPPHLEAYPRPPFGRGRGGPVHPGYGIPGAHYYGAHPYMEMYQQPTYFHSTPITPSMNPYAVLTPTTLQNTGKSELEQTATGHESLKPAIPKSGKNLKDDIQVSQESSIIPTQAPTQPKGPSKKTTPIRESGYPTKLTEKREKQWEEDLSARGLNGLLTERPDLKQMMALMTPKQFAALSKHLSNGGGQKSSAVSQETQARGTPTKCSDPKIPTLSTTTQNSSSTVCVNESGQ